MDIQIEFLSTSVLADKQGKAKTEFILENIKENKIIVLEDPLTPHEEKMLIEETMKRITTKFPGIEISTLGVETDGFKTRIIKFLGGKTGGITVIGPSKLVKEVTRDPQRIKLLATSTDRNKK